jgi:adenosylhomocysteinase
VHARHGATADEFTADLLAVGETEPELVIDDGLELTRRIAQHRPDAYERLLGVSEETTTGVARLRALEAEGRLPFPAVAANDARCKHMFDNPYGTGQATLTAILALTNVLAAGREFCVVGYGWVGQGLARAASGLGGRVTVVEIDPVRALTAHMDGHRVAPLQEALPHADIVITATGLTEAIPAGAFELLKDGVLLANAGHYDREIDVPALAAAAGACTCSSTVRSSTSPDSTAIPSRSWISRSRSRRSRPSTSLRHRSRPDCTGSRTSSMT